MTDIAKVNGIAVASIAEINGISSIGKVNGLVKVSSSFSATKCIEFDSGSSQYINFGNVLNETGDNDFTLAIWMKPVNHGNLGTGVICINKSDGVGTEYRFGYQSNYGSYFQWGDSGHGSGYLGYDATGWKESTITDGNWHLIVVTWTGANKTGTPAIGYYDGNNQISGGYNSNTLDSGADLTTSSDLVICKKSPSHEDFYKGRIGGISKWSIALSGSEIAELYNGGHLMDLSSHSRWSTINGSARGFWLHPENVDLETSGGVVDLSSNAYAGTAVNMSNSTDLVADVP